LGRELRLDHNFRSPPSIVAFADAALGRRSLMADAPADAVPTITEYATASDEAAGVALALQAAHRSGRPWSECAVLARTNAQLGVLADALSAAGVPCGDAPDDVVHLATFHRAKGLEWPIVFATGLEDGLVPFGAPPPGQRRDEERRLLYVALTRASGALHCSWARSRDLGEGPRTRRPSPWLAAMSATCDELDARRPPVDLRAELRALRVSLAAGAPPAPTVAARKRASARSA
jgi:DNA helicase-2/ATP-dependent DNA helicase PcrA